MREGAAGRRRGPAALAVRAVLGPAALLVLLVAGCGQAPLGVTPHDTTPADPTLSYNFTSSTGRAATSLPPAVTDVVGNAFSRLATAAAPMAVFSPAVLPEGASLAAYWLPVLDAMDPALYDGPPLSNPYVVGEGIDTEIQVVLSVGKGWLVIIENFHGDLGDVTGIGIGEVEGSPAALFEVNGGDLVQWSRDGRWYGVFGRGVSRDVILAAALGMKVNPAKCP